jgi:hypothetical protein
MLVRVQNTAQGKTNEIDYDKLAAQGIDTQVVQTNSSDCAAALRAIKSYASSIDYANLRRVESFSKWCEEQLRLTKTIQGSQRESSSR